MYTFSEDGRALQTGKPDSIKCFVEAAKARENEVYYRIEEDIVSENLISDISMAEMAQILLCLLYKRAEFAAFFCCQP